MGNKGLDYTALVIAVIGGIYLLTFFGRVGNGRDE